MNFKDTIQILREIRENQPRKKSRHLEKSYYLEERLKKSKHYKIIRDSRSLYYFSYPQVELSQDRLDFLQQRNLIAVKSREDLADMLKISPREFSEIQTRNSDWQEKYKRLVSIHNEISKLFSGASYYMRFFSKKRKSNLESLVNELDESIKHFEEAKKINKILLNYTLVNGSYVALTKKGINLSGGSFCDLGPGVNFDSSFDTAYDRLEKSRKSREDWRAICEIATKRNTPLEMVYNTWEKLGESPRAKKIEVVLGCRYNNRSNILKSFYKTANELNISPENITNVYFGLEKRLGEMMPQIGILPDLLKKAYTALESGKLDKKANEIYKNDKRLLVDFDSDLWTNFWTKKVRRITTQDVTPQEFLEFFTYKKLGKVEVNIPDCSKRRRIQRISMDLESLFEHATDAECVNPTLLDIPDDMDSICSYLKRSSASRRIYAKINPSDIECICAYGSVLYKNFPKIEKKRLFFFSEEVNKSPSDFDIMVITRNDVKEEKIIRTVKRTEEYTVEVSSGGDHYMDPVTTGYITKTRTVFKGPVLKFRKKGYGAMGGADLHILYYSLDRFLRGVKEGDEISESVVRYGIPLVGAKRFDEIVKDIKNLKREALHRVELVEDENGWLQGEII